MSRARVFRESHLLHEESYKYLQEAKRVVRPGGKILVSFLEFRMRSHWSLFEATMRDARPDKVLRQFLSRDAFEAWAAHAGLTIVALHDGPDPFIPIEGTLEWSSGLKHTGKASFGQSLCVLAKP